MKIELTGFSYKVLERESCGAMFLQVPWPVNIVLNSQSMAVYSQVFSFLLQIKRVKFCLDELKFTGKNYFFMNTWFSKGSWFQKSPAQSQITFLQRF